MINLITLVKKYDVLIWWTELRGQFLSFVATDSQTFGMVNMVNAHYARPPVRSCTGELSSTIQYFARAYSMHFSTILLKDWLWVVYMIYIYVWTVVHVVHMQTSGVSLSILAQTTSGTLDYYVQYFTPGTCTSTCMSNPLFNIFKCPVSCP